jgi:hypothetical protein
VTVPQICELVDADWRLPYFIGLTRWNIRSLWSFIDARRSSGTPVPTASRFAGIRVSGGGAESSGWEEKQGARVPCGGGRHLIGFGGRRLESWHSRAPGRCHRATSSIGRLKKTPCPTGPTGQTHTKTVWPAGLGAGPVWWAGAVGCGQVSSFFYFFLFCFVFYFLFSSLSFQFDFQFCSAGILNLGILLWNRANIALVQYMVS